MAEGEEDLDALWADEPPRRQVQAAEPAPTSSEEDSYFQGSQDGSDDTAARQAREAAARLKDYGEEEEVAQERGAAGGALPSAAAVFSTVEGPPAYLDPEATRPLAVALHKAVNNVGAGGAALPDPHSQNRLMNKRGQAVGEWDVSKMAPKLKEELQAKGVITGAAVRFRTDERVGTISAAQIAMLGGNVGGDDDGNDEAGAPAGPGSKHPVPKGKASKPMGVDEFLEKGVGGALLPRKRQDRKDKEKDKRVKGQSTHANWKSEAEMALRQQYD